MSIHLKAEDRKIAGSSHSLLSRYAENAFWMGRYVERAENTARLVSVTENFANDDEDAEAWRALLNVFAETEGFEALGKPVNAQQVAKYFLTRLSSPSSVISNISLVKENARGLRHLLSTEAWVQIYRFHDAVSSLSGKSMALSKLPQHCELIRNHCHEHHGVIEATCYRDEVWIFRKMGVALERADQITRLVDMKYFQIDTQEGSHAAPPDIVWWNSLLRSASAYHAFRRRHSFNPEPDDAARFLLFDGDFPRSVCAAMNEFFDGLGELGADYDARPDEDVAAAQKRIEALTGNPSMSLRGQALHHLIDEIQSGLIGLSNAVSARYFATS